MSSINKITGIVAGQYGTAITLEVVDDEGIVVDLSSFTGITVRSISSDARTTLSFTGSCRVAAPIRVFTATVCAAKATWTGFRSLTVPGG